MAKSILISIDQADPDSDVIMHAAAIIKRGGLVAFPTETVYGLGCDSMNPDAVKKVYHAKGREGNKPLLVLIADPSWLAQLTDTISDAVHSLLDTFWPGPVTFIFPALPGVPRELLGAGTTIGVRFPGRSTALTLVEAVGRPITAPSANRSGTPNPLTAREVGDSLGDSVDMILDGGPASNDRPSTVVDLSNPEPSLVRDGRIPFDTILQAWRSYND